jgi:drug/metabolite transporter (DMT)-like permease
VARKSKVETFVLAFAVVAMNSFGNLSLAWGMKRLPHVGANPLHYIGAMFNPFVAAGIGMLILWLLMRMALMSWADLSFALPVTALGYVMGTVLGKVFLHESVTSAQWTGTLFIFAGILLVGTTAQQSARHNAPL